MREPGASGGCYVYRGEVADAAAVRGVYSDVAFMGRQVHSVAVAEIASAEDPVPEADALVTFRDGLTVGVLTADCVPILLYAPDLRGVAAVHAGWKGTLGGIVGETVSYLMECGAAPEKMVAAFGPSIGVGVYEVSPEVGEMFADAGFSSCVVMAGRPHIDLQRVNRERMLRLGLLPDHIRLHPGCTFTSLSPDCLPLYPSHRRSGGAPARLLTAIRLIP